MNKPSCYPDSCFTCESPSCYEELTCPYCKEPIKLNIYCEDSDCPCCGEDVLTEPETEEEQK